MHASKFYVVYALSTFGFLYFKGKKKKKKQHTNQKVDKVSVSCLPERFSVVHRS